MSKKTRGATKDANRRRERHARKTSHKLGHLGRHGKRALMATIGSFQRALAREPTGIVQWSSPGASVDFVPGKGLVLTLPGRIENYIKIDFDIGPEARP